MSAHRSQIYWSGSHAVVVMPAEIDVLSSPSVENLLATLLAEVPAVVTADLSQTDFCDSAGVHVLARAHRTAAGAGTELRLCIGDSPCARILELTGLDQVLPVYPDVRQSLATPPQHPGSPPVPASDGSVTGQG